MTKSLFGLLCFLSFSAFGQGNRVRDSNQVGWYVYAGDHQLSEKWAVRTELQWRRIDFIRSWQQLLARLGAVYQLSDKAKLSAGYTFLYTHPYGEHPVADTGNPYPEHRLYEDVQIGDTVGILNLEHRIRLEQRWLGQLENGSPTVVGWQYQHRIRYQLSGILPLQGRTLDSREVYLTFFDELFIGFGTNVGNNVFNQNRIFGGIGYQIKDNMQIELGYFNQILLHGEADPATNKPVFEYNHGFRLGLSYDIDFTQ